MSIESQRLLLHAYLDGALEPACAIALRAQIAADPKLAAELAGASALQKTLRAHFPLEPVSAAVERRIDAAISRPV
jgi:anti-sigma factor RsiW